MKKEKTKQKLDSHLFVGKTNKKWPDRMDATSRYLKWGAGGRLHGGFAVKVQ
jgi:hypothetical protein